MASTRLLSCLSRRTTAPRSKEAWDCAKVGTAVSASISIGIRFNVLRSREGTPEVYHPSYRAGIFFQSNLHAAGMGAHLLSCKLRADVLGGAALRLSIGMDVCDGRSRLNMDYPPSSRLPAFFPPSYFRQCFCSPVQPLHHNVRAGRVVARLPRPKPAPRLCSPGKAFSQPQHTQGSTPLITPRPLKSSTASQPWRAKWAKRSMTRQLVHSPLLASALCSPSFQGVLLVGMFFNTYLYGLVTAQFLTYRNTGTPPRVRSCAQSLTPVSDFKDPLWIKYARVALS